MKWGKQTKRATAAVTAAAIAAVCMPMIPMEADSASVPNYVNVWTGYVIQNPDNLYMTVYGGENAKEGALADFYDADGVALYNTWYFVETEGGYALRSGLDEGQYYLHLQESKHTFTISTKPQALYRKSGETWEMLYEEYQNQWMPVPVTGLIKGDLTYDNRLDIMDLARMRQFSTVSADFVEKAVADLNGDGAVNAEDLVQLQSFLQGQTAPTFSAVELPVCTIVPQMPDLPVQTTTTETTTTNAETTTTVTEPEQWTMADFPEEYRYAADWIWDNRIAVEKSTERRNTIFDQIVAGDGTINYVVRWQSYKSVTLEQRRQFEQLVSDSINGWTSWLSGWDGWKYDHVEVNIVGWAVLDKSVLLDLQPDEVVYDSLISDYDASYDTSNGVETIPDKLPSAPAELSRFDHFMDTSYMYPGGIDARFDMYLWATQGFPAIGGCGGDWGQRLSDDAYFNMLNGIGIHVLEHEIGHGFGMTDFYGGEGASDGFPPGGFPGGENSIMMAGSASKITDFDGWMLRYMWSMIKDEEGRFLQ